MNSALRKGLRKHFDALDYKGKPLSTRVIKGVLLLEEKCIPWTDKIFSEEVMVDKQPLGRVLTHTKKNMDIRCVKPHAKLGVPQGHKPHDYALSCHVMPDSEKERFLWSQAALYLRSLDRAKNVIGSLLWTP
jgi:hypothetical protein